MSRTEADPPKPKLDLIFYPAYCYSASPTWSKWVKLTCWDVHHALRTHQQQGKSFTSGTSANQTLFYLNHPIQYVQLVGIVVAIEDYYESHFLLTLDDSSGATLDVVVRKPKSKRNGAQTSSSILAPATTTNKGTTTATTTTATTTNSTSAADNNNDDDPSIQETLSLLHHLSALTLSTPILAKGTLSTFRSVRQLTLLRLTTLPNTSTELTHIASRTAFLASTLGKPWHLSAPKQRKLREAAESDRAKSSGRQRRERERQREQREWEARREARLGEVWEWEEGEREREADVAREDGRVLMDDVRSRRSRRETAAKAEREE